MAPLKLSQQKCTGANYQVLGDSGAEAGPEGKEEEAGKVGTDPPPLQKMEMFID